MLWIWTLQILFDVALAVLVWKLLARRKDGNRIDFSEQERFDSQQLEQYCQSIDELTEQFEQQAEKWCLQLDKKARMARMLCEHLDERYSAERNKAAVAVPSEKEEGESRQPMNSSRLHREVVRLHELGFSIDDISRQLQVGRREVHLMLSLRQKQ